MFYLITLTQQIDAVRILYVIYRESASNLCLDLLYRERGQIVDDNFYNRTIYRFCIYQFLVQFLFHAIYLIEI